MATLKIQGIGKRILSPNKIILEYTLKGLGDSTRQAKEKLKELEQRFLDLSQEQGVSDLLRIKSSFIREIVDHDRFGNISKKRYQMEKVYRLKGDAVGTDLLEFAEEASEDLNIEANIIYFLEVSDEVKEKLFESAVKDAEKKAKFILAPLSKSLGKILEISYVGTPQNYGHVRAMSASAAGNVEAADQEIFECVEIVYEI